MIFGFNTDISFNGTVYHVQTEVRAQAGMLESQVFVQGRCIAKRSTGLPPGAEEQETHSLARMQHRELVEAIRSGDLEEMASSGAATEESQNEDSQNEDSRNDAASEAGTANAAAALQVEFLGARRLSASEVMLRFRVRCGGSAAAGAEVSARCTGGDATLGETRLEAAAANATADGEGIAELRLALAGGNAELELRARRGGQEAARRFLLKSARS